MGLVGDYFADATAESFFATLECELIERETFSDRSEARLRTNAPPRASITHRSVKAVTCPVYSGSLYRQSVGRRQKYKPSSNPQNVPAAVFADSSVPRWTTPN